MPDKRCECETCVYGREVRLHLQMIPEPARGFFRDMYDRLCTAEDEICYTNSVLAGTWPNSREILEASLKKLEASEQ